MNKYFIIILLCNCALANDLILSSKPVNEKICQENIKTSPCFKNRYLKNGEVFDKYEKEHKINITENGDNNEQMLLNKNNKENKNQ